GGKPDRDAGGRAGQRSGRRPAHQRGAFARSASRHRAGVRAQRALRPGHPARRGLARTACRCRGRGAAFPSVTGVLESYFHLREAGSDVRRETLAGLTTFLAMAYILFVNPAVLSQAGMDFGAVFTATCLSAAIATLVMGLVANYPIALAPGMGQNFFFLTLV